MVIKDNIRDFNLEHIFDCGQCFRWNKEADGSYTGIAFEKPVNIKFQTYIDNGFEGQLSIDNINEQEFSYFWKNYLDLDTDYGEVKSVLAENDLIMKEAIKSGQGIRILKQEPWETLISFIISQNNNIPRIKKCIENLCEMFGQSVGTYQGKDFFAFPKAEIIAELTEEDLAPVKLGYRAKYIIETARKVVSDNANVNKSDKIDRELLTLDSLCQQDMTKGYDYLTSLCGVGPKVANCILLFGMGKYDSFPIDVWVRRVMHKLYDIEENDTKSMTDYASKHFGEYGGIAQQYLFYHIRQIEKS